MRANDKKTVHDNGFKKTISSNDWVSVPVEDSGSDRNTQKPVAQFELKPF